MGRESRVERKDFAKESSVMRGVSNGCEGPLNRYSLIFEYRQIFTQID